MMTAMKWKGIFEKVWWFITLMEHSHHGYVDARLDALEREVVRLREGGSPMPASPKSREAGASDRSALR
jgi:hypothetical protein